MVELLVFFIIEQVNSRAPHAFNVVIVSRISLVCVILLLLETTTVIVFSLVAIKRLLEILS
jgi:inner membrane protein involved in colicin E2 resistance